MTNSTTVQSQLLLGAFLVAIFAMLAPTATAQSQSQYDKGTPPQFAAGVSPLGSYASADIGTVNLSNGALNLKLPLGTVGGRGLSLPLTLNWSSKIWSASIDYDAERGCGRGGCDDPNPSMVPLAYADYANADSLVSFLSRMEAGWTIGGTPFLVQRVVRINYTNIQPRGPCYDFTLPKLTMMMPDRGEIEFRDDNYDGAPLPSDCGGYTALASRGHRWHATDGSGLIYLNTPDNGAAGRFPDLTGVVITGEGTRFYLNAGGGCYLIVDRNGNKIRIDGNQIVDPLGRSTTIQQNVTDPENPSETLAVLVTVTGYNGVPRYYKVRSGIMNEHYRSDVNPTLPVVTGSYDPMSWGYNNWWPASATRLFSLSYGLFAQRIDDRPVITELVLPDDRLLQFKYNQFGEVAEVQMPTGGKVWYDYGYQGTLPSGNSPVFETSGEYHTSVPQVDRALTQRRTFPDGSNLEGTWDYTYGGSTVIVTASAPDGTLLLNQTHSFLPSGRYTDSPAGGHDGTYYNLWSTGVEWRSETRNETDVVIAASEQDGTQRAAVSWSTYPQEQPANDNRVNEERKILDDGSTAKVYTYYLPSVKYNNPIEVQEFDFDQTLKRRTVTTYADSNHLINGLDYTADSIHLLHLPLGTIVYDVNSNKVAESVNEYDNYEGDQNHAPLQSYGSIIQHEVNYGPANLIRGNLTRAGRWLNLTNSFVYNYPRYDDLGNVVSAKDPNGNVATISFADSFGDGHNPEAGAAGAFGPTYALPTLVTSPPPTPGAPVQTAYSQYDFSTGLLTGFKDRNGIITQSFYNDPFNRPTLVKTALGISSVEAHASMYYAPVTALGITLTNNDVLTASDQTTLDDAALRSWTHTDGFGRTVESWSRDPQGDDKAITIYDALGRASKHSNPFRPSLGETAAFTTTAFDLAGRVTLVTTPDNAVVETAYDGNRVLVADQNDFDQLRRKRISKTDALGRLKDVWEVTAAGSATEAVSFPGWPSVTAGYHTSYSYDTLDNLISVTQGSQTPRSFAYDSLNRLISASNPESGTINYQYDNSGNLLVKADARGVATHYDYDALSRLVRRWYNSDSSLAATTHNLPQLPSDVGASDEVKYFYDSQPLPPGAPNSSSPDFYARGYATGRLVAMTYGGGSSGNYFGYDATGKTVLGIQQTGTVNYKTSATYNLSGALLTEIYPSGRNVTNTYDSAGRTNSFTGNLGEGGTNRNYSTSITYSPLGGLAQERFGTATPIYNKLFYNVRGQLSEIREGETPNNTDWERGAIINHYSDHCWGMCYNNNPSVSDSMTDNNGNLRKQSIYMPGNDRFSTQWFDYDSLNRLQSARETDYVYSTSQEHELWRQGYSYDRYGNRTIAVGYTSGNLNPKAFEVEISTNRLLAPGDSNTPLNQRQMQYDAIGNLKTDTYTDPNLGQRKYNPENRMSQVWANGQWQTYTYDGDGRRVKRNVNGSETWQVYGLGGELIADYGQNNTSPSSPQKEYGYRTGQLLITATVGTAGWGTPPSFDDNPLNPPNQPKTDVRATHITQLRAAVNAVRSHYNLGAYQWQKPTASGGAINNTVLISWEPIDEMRTALNEALGPPPSPGYTPGLAWNQPILAAHIQELRNRVLNAWITSTGGVDIRWLVSDQLGTPRMIFDQSGSLANTSRHDYLPFGEELFAGTAGRTTALGYTNGDSARQKFTSKERDIETGLDYFLARYYSSTQGRFTSVDPENAGADLEKPQSWNGYAHALNNPITNTDPDGLKVRICGTDGQCTEGKTDLSDEDFYKYFRDAKGIKLKDGNVYQNGNLIGTYQRLSFDDLNDFANSVIFGRGNTAGLVQRLPIVQKVVTVGAAVDVGLIATVYVGVELAGASVRTLGLDSLAGRSIQQLNGLLRGTQQQLLRQLFGRGVQGAQRALAGLELPAGLTREALLVYAEIARRYIEQGKDASGVQALRLEIIKQALEKLK